MNYHFKVKTTASDLWQLSMYGTYGSMLGMTNVVFTAAMVLLAVRFFPGAHIVLKCLLILAILIFPVIQPFLVYLQAVKQAKNLTKEVDLGFDDEGMHVSIGQQKETIRWDAVKGITKKPTLLVIFSSAQHGYVLNNKVLGEQREAFYNYIISKTDKGK
jgi:hypothetical protein